MKVTRQSILRIVGPGGVWTLHFIAVYALISAACAPRQLLQPDALLLGIAAVTVVSLSLCLLRVVLPYRRDPPEIRRAAFWSGLIFGLAVLANSASFLFLQNCGA